jgi:hypothetical protein
MLRDELGLKIRLHISSSTMSMSREQEPSASSRDSRAARTPHQTQDGWYNQDTLRSCETMPMPSVISDTSQAAEQMQLALLRQAGMVRRVDLAAELTSFAIEAAYTTFRRRYPEASALEIDLLFVEQQYGLALAHRLLAAPLPSAGVQDQ